MQPWPRSPCRDQLSPVQLSTLQLVVRVDEITDVCVPPASTGIFSFLSLELQLFTLWYRSVFRCFVQIKHQIGFKVSLNDPNVLSETSAMWKGREAQSYGEHGALREPCGGGWGGVAEEHLPYALWVRPQTKAQQIQAGRAARPSLEWGRGESGVCVCVCVWGRVCVFSKWGDGRHGNLFVGVCDNWLIIDDLGLSNDTFTSGWCLCPFTLCWWPFPPHSLTLPGGWGRGSLPWDSSQLKAAPHPWGVGKRMERHFKGRSTADVKQCRRRSRGAGLQNGTCWAETHGGGGSWNVD